VRFAPERPTATFVAHGAGVAARTSSRTRTSPPLSRSSRIARSRYSPVRTSSRGSDVATAPKLPGSHRNRREHERNRDEDAERSHPSRKRHVSRSQNPSHYGFSGTVTTTSNAFMFETVRSRETLEKTRVLSYEAPRQLKPRPHLSGRDQASRRILSSLRAPRECPNRGAPDHIERQLSAEDQSLAPAHHTGFRSRVIAADRLSPIHHRSEPPTDNSGGTLGHPECSICNRSTAEADSLLACLVGATSCCRDAYARPASP
jgi:hypothetical protein